MLRIFTAGESHGKYITAILEGIPSNLYVDAGFINKELKKRQGGYGRGGRMKIETDEAEIVSGVRSGLTTGAPICILIENKDYVNWKDIIGADAKRPGEKSLTKVRPGHADLSGVIKYGFKDARNILERASARETSARVAAGAICKLLLSGTGVETVSHILSVGGEKIERTVFGVDNIRAKIASSDLYCTDEKAEQRMKDLIDSAKANGDTLGGKIEVIAAGMPVGVGSHTQFDRKLDYALFGLVGSIQAVKSVAIGAGDDYASNFGSKMHDEIFFQNKKIIRKTNNAGGIEGGMTNGEDIVLSAAIKPIPTLMKGLRTVDILSGEEAVAANERSDVCAVPAAAVVCENVVAYGLANSLLETFGGDTMEELKERIEKRRKAANDFIFGK